MQSEPTLHEYVCETCYTAQACAHVPTSWTAIGVTTYVCDACTDRLRSFDRQGQATKTGMFADSREDPRKGTNSTKTAIYGNELVNVQVRENNGFTSYIVKILGVVHVLNELQAKALFEAITTAFHELQPEYFSGSEGVPAYILSDIPA